MAGDGVREEAAAGATVASTDALAGFAEPTRAWFTTTFGAPTDAQAGAWPAIAGGGHVLLCAPTGSGKTLAAFLSAIDDLARQPAPDPPATSVVYVSPLRALAVDVDKNLRAPLRGIALAAERLGVPMREPTVGVRTGDTPAQDRRTLARHPPDILITTPESLYLMLTSSVRDTLRQVRTVIIDEIHAVAATKRGSHLAVTLERLERMCEQPPQRIGLSATQRPLSEIAHFLGGNRVDPTSGEVRGARPVTIVDAGVRKTLDLEVVVPIEDMGALGEIVDEPVSGPASGGPVRRSIWPSVHPRLLELIQSHRSTIVFVNARRLAERLATRLNELAIEGENRGAEAQGRSPGTGAELVKAHHGSLSRTQRLLIEDDLKSGRLKGLVATSSLELGIDMGAVDLVVQVGSPNAVATGLQRVGRAGHQVGAPSSGRFFPKHRGDLLETAVVVRRMVEGEIESTRYVRNPLDVAAQQIVAACALDEWSRPELVAVLRGAAPYTELSDELVGSVLDLLDGRYPSEAFSELRPRIVWDRATDTVRGRSGAQRLAVQNAGTIPDRGLFGVVLPDGTRVGELDEEMVYESRVGETFLLGATTWRIEDITFERVVVTPAPGLPGKMPFWHGEGPGRPVELGRAVGAFVREVRGLPHDAAVAKVRTEHHLDEWAAANLVAFLDEQAESTGVVPDDRTIVVERFRDEIGDWRICVLTPFGARVHAPWGLAIRRRLEASGASDVEIMWSDDGIIFRLPEAAEVLDLDDLLVDPDEVTDIVVGALPDSALFAARFREAAARALLLPRRRVDQRTPLWQQRQKAGSLLAVAAQYPTFPILLETTRECVNDVFDLPALVDVLAGLRDRRIRVVQVDTPSASPMAASLLFGWIANFMYEGDAPLAERRAAALALDRDLLRDLLGSEELRSLLDAEVVARVEAELQHLVEGRRARDADEVHDLLRVLGPLSVEELAERFEAPDAPAAVAGVAAAVAELVAARRAIEVVVAGEARLADAADAARLRDALGVAIPVGLPAAFTDPVERPLRDLVERHARTHGPFTTTDVAERLGASAESVALVLGELERDGRVIAGEFRPAGTGAEWCDAEVMRRLRRRTLAALRHEVEPVEADVLGRFLPAWQGVGSERRGVDALADVIGQLQGAPLVASMLERDVLPLRLADYRPTDLDALCTSGDVVWIGAGGVGSTDGRVRLLFRDDAAVLVDPVAAPVADAAGAESSDASDRPSDPHHEVLRATLAERGATFWPDLVNACAAASLPYDEATVLAALWDLVWAGEVTNDSLAPLRARASGAKSSGGGAAASRRARSRGLRTLRSAGPPAGAGRWSLVADLLRPTPSPTEAATARARQLLERYGVLTREMALAEGVTAGFAGVYPVLKAMEEQGQVRRGYFVAGMGAAQFATHAAVDRLRTFRSTAADLAAADEVVDAEVLVLAATDPAQPYGASVPWPSSDGRPQRAAGARVVLADGRCVAWLDRSGRALLTFDGLDEVAGWADALAALVRSGRVRRLELAKIDGVSSAESRHADALRAAGFADGYRGLVLRA